MLCELDAKGFALQFSGRAQTPPPPRKVVVPQAERTRTPNAGETLILADGRRFVVSSAATDARGWWFTATAQDGASTLQGSLSLEWDAQAGVWRPLGARGAGTAPAVAAARWAMRKRMTQPD